jgi:hypothetical protein
MQEIEISIGGLLRIYWLLFWRGLVGGLVFGFVQGFIIGFVMGAAGFPRAQITPVTASVGIVVGIIWSVVVLKMAIRKRYKDFRIALIAQDEPLLL